MHRRFAFHKVTSNAPPHRLKAGAEERCFSLALPLFRFNRYSSAIDISRYQGRAAAVAAREAYQSTAAMAGTAAYGASSGETSRSEQAIQAVLLRDIFPNSFRSPLTLDPAWLRWNDGAISRIAQAIYDERRFEDLPILADALEEAGNCAGRVRARWHTPRGVLNMGIRHQRHFLGGPPLGPRLR